MNASLCLKTLFSTIALTTLTFSLSSTARADTDHLREFAKNKTRLLIVVSGPSALPSGESLEKAIETNGDFAGRSPNDVRVVELSAAEPLLTGEFAKASVVFLLAASDGATPASMNGTAAQRLPFESNFLGGKISIVRSAQVKDRPGEPVFNIGMYAPDSERLGLLYKQFTGHRAGSFRDLPFTERYNSNRLALFVAPQNRKGLVSSGGWEWGSEGNGNRDEVMIWNDIDTYDLAEREGLPDEKIGERTEVYFINRATDTVIPEPARRALEGKQIKRNATVVAYRPGGNRENPIYVVSAPTRSLLEVRLRDGRTVASLTELSGGKSTEYRDLSGVREASLLIVGGGPGVSPEMADALHAEIATRLRNDFGVGIEPRGATLTAMENELALQMTRGATDTRGFLRRRYPTRYAWVFLITQASGSTTYGTDERKITQGMAAFSDPEPSEPRRRDYDNDDEFDNRWRRWRSAWREWDTSRRRYEDRYRTAPCEWALSVVRKSRAEVRGFLQLIDQQGTNGPTFLWEKECAFSQTREDVVREQRVTVRGHDNRPDSLTTPAPAPTCVPSVLQATAFRACADGLNSLWGEALLPGEIAPLPEPVPAPAAPAGAPVAPAAPAPAPTTWDGGKVADVDGQTVVLNIGKKRGVKVGERYEVLLAYKETTDPDTGKVLRLRVTESLILVVTAVDDESADARPATPQDAAKLKQIKAGTRVRKVTPALK